MNLHLDKEFHLHFLRSVAERAKGAAFEPLTPLEVEAWVTPEPVGFGQRESGRRLELKEGDRWGELWDCAWMRVRGVAPETGGRPMVLLLDVEGEACVHDVAGNPLRGLTHMQAPSFIFPQGKRVFWLPQGVQPGTELDYWLDCGANDLFGEPSKGPRETPTIGCLREARAGACNVELRALFYDMIFLLELAEVLPPKRTRRMRVLKVLTDAACLLNDYTEEEAAAARAVLASEVGRRGPQDPSLTLSAIGHAHIDLAWLWPIRETKRKGVRSFASVLANMDRHPEYHFTSSQPQLMEWVREQSPALVERIKERVSEGRWELQGGMWVEADNNLTGGESLARQFLHGQRHTMEHFGRRTEVLWLPDCFGYSAAMPQIARLSGVEYFVSIKPSWNLFNKLPFTSFVWQGLDGSELLSHMPPADCYNTPATPITLRNVEEQHQDKATVDEVLLLYGVGDGGGGPDAEHLEALRREANTEGLPAVRHGRARDFFERLETQRDQLARWSGEIYLERHQGTFTTQAANKRGNRQAECRLREAELACMCRKLATGEAYPRAALDRLWKEVLLLQFHDILPGSSINRVHKESRGRYAAILGELDAMIRGTAPAAGPRAVLNPLSWERREWVQSGDHWVRPRVPALGAALLDEEPAPGDFREMAAGEDLLSNGILTLRFAPDGSVASLYDHSLRKEFIAPDETLNRLVLFHDWWVAGTSDAWDINPIYRQRVAGQARLLNAEWEVDGPMACRRHVLEVGSSRIEQEIVLLEGSRRVDFRTRVDWRERGKMLRATFPVDIHAEKARCEVQFGHVERAVHENTTWDQARFEVCAQKWVDLSQGDRGIALLNDGKHGHSLHKGRLELALMRSPTYPDAEADAGMHEFTYALYPHGGGPLEAGVVQAANELNFPLRVLPAEGLVPSSLLGRSLLKVTPAQVIVEALKPAEDDPSAWIVRLYESRGGECAATVKCAVPMESAQLVNILEDPIEEVAVGDGSVDLVFRPFEIKTLKLLGVGGRAGAHSEQQA